MDCPGNYDKEMEEYRMKLEKENQDREHRIEKQQGRQNEESRSRENDRKEAEE